MTSVRLPPGRLAADDPATSRPTGDRFTELEIALAHQERVTEELNEVVREQAGRLDRLERTLAALARRLAAMEEAPEAPEADAPPPHW
jgi:SlyX protein